MQRGLVLVSCVLLLGIAFAGCMGDEESTGRTAKRAGTKVKEPPALSALEKRLGAQLQKPAEGTVRDWHVGAMLTSPEGRAAAYDWTIPPGGVIGQRDAGSRGVVLEVAPLVVNSTVTIEQWAVFAFFQEAGKNRLVAAFMGAPLEVTIEDAIRPTQKESRPVPLQPRHLQINFANIRDGQTLSLVFAAKATTVGEVALLVRPMDHFPTRAELPPPTVDDFINATGTLKPFALRYKGSAEGFHFAMYTNFSNLVSNPAGYQRVVAQTASLKVQERLPVGGGAVATLRDTTFTSDFETPSGWSYSQGSFNGLCATGKWEARSAFHGKTLVSRSVVAQHICAAIYPWFAEAILFGVPQYIHSAEGEGKSTATLDLAVGNAAIESTVFLHVAFGSPLARLLGAPGQDIYAASTGVVGNVPPTTVLTQGRDLALLGASDAIIVVANAR